MPGRIDGREDYLALVKTWSDQLEPYTDEQVKEACRRLMGKLKRFPYPSDVRDELAPVSIASTTVISLSVEVDSSSIDAALVKAEQLRHALAPKNAVHEAGTKAVNASLSVPGSDAIAAAKEWLSSAEYCLQLGLPPPTVTPLQKALSSLEAVQSLAQLKRDECQLASN